MAITVTNRDLGATDTPGTSYATNSVAFQNNKLYLASFAQRTQTSTISAVTGGGVTWVQVNTVAGTNSVAYVFRGLVTSGASTGALTVTCASGTAAHWIVDELDGIDTSGTNGSGAIVQSVTATANSAAPSVTLAAFGDAVNNLTYAAIAAAANQNTITAEAGFTAVQTNVLTAPAHGLLREYLLGQDTTPSGTCTSAVWTDIGLEVKAAAGAAATVKNLMMLGMG